MVKNCMKSSSDLRAKVLHITWNAIRGGTEGQCARVALQFPHHRVALFRLEGHFLGALTAHCGPIYEIRIHAIRSLRTLTEIWRLSAMIKRQGIQWVHAWDADAAVFGAIAARWAGVPLITSRRDMGDIYAPWKLRLMDRADHQARYVIVNADSIKQRRIQEGLPSEKIVLIPNMLDVEEFDAAAAGGDPDLPPGRWMALVARLDPEKDIETAIRALALVRGRGIDVRLVIAGDGVERPRLERVASECKVTAAVRFLGDTSAIPGLLSRCEIGLLTPSSNEGLSNTVLEYMAAELPVVATDCGGNRELVEDGATGFIVPIGHYDAIANAIMALLEDPRRAKSMGAGGRRRVLERHSPAIVARQFSSLYDS